MMAMESSQGGPMQGGTRRRRAGAGPAKYFEFLYF